MNNFRTIANQARTTRTTEDTLKLVEAYAVSGCAMYPADVDLVNEVFNYGLVEGYVFRKCIVDYGGGSFVVARAEAPNGKLTVADGCEGLS